jgi:hypothetical protein
MKQKIDNLVKFIESNYAIRAITFHVDYEEFETLLGITLGQEDFINIQDRMTEIGYIILFTQETVTFINHSLLNSIRYLHENEFTEQWEIFQGLDSSVKKESHLKVLH